MSNTDRDREITEPHSRRAGGTSTPANQYPAGTPLVPSQPNSVTDPASRGKDGTAEDHAAGNPEVSTSSVAAKNTDGHIISWVKTFLPGIGLCLLGTVVALVINHFVPTVSAMLIGILLGALLANTVAVPAVCADGVAFSAKRLLRIGIVLLGLQIVFGDIQALGWGMILVVVAIVGVGVLGTNLIGKAMGIDFKQRILIACGFSICGAAAVAGCETVVKAKREEIATALALVVVYGTIMIPVVPLLTRLFGMDAEVSGLGAGGSIHEVAQVVAAGGIIENHTAGALNYAVIVKLARVIMLAPVMAGIGIMMRKFQEHHPGQGAKVPLVPGFVIGFLGAVVVASINQKLGWISADVLRVVKYIQAGLLSMAMFALGCGIDVKALKSVGWKPIALGFIATVLVAIVALVGVLLVR